MLLLVILGEKVKSDEQEAHTNASAGRRSGSHGRTCAAVRASWVSSKRTCQDHSTDSGVCSQRIRLNEEAGEKRLLMGQPRFKPRGVV